MLCNTGHEAVRSDNGLLTTIAFQFGPNCPINYALEGSGSIGGNAVKFLRDNMGFIREAADIEEICNGLTSTEGLYFVPSFSGMYTPYWDATARGLIVGMTQRTKPGHICLAALKAVAFQTAEIVEAIEKDFKSTVMNLKIDGGMTNNKLFTQMLADTLGKRINCPQLSEVTALGAAISAGIGAGLITLESIINYPSRCTNYECGSDIATRNAELITWKDAVSRALNWLK